MGVLVSLRRTWLVEALICRPLLADLVFAFAMVVSGSVLMHPLLAPIVKLAIAVLGFVVAGLSVVASLCTERSNTQLAWNFVGVNVFPLFVLGDAAWYVVEEHPDWFWSVTAAWGAGWLAIIFVYYLVSGKQKAAS